MEKYHIRYYYTNYFGVKTEVCNETYHPLNKSDLEKFANIKCGIYNLTYTTEIVKEN